jgi:hypothetical protein
MALAALAAVVGLAAAGCGDDDSADGGSTGTSTSTGGASATAATPTTLVATELVPKLNSQGFDQTNPEKFPDTGLVDIAFSIYQKAGPPMLQARAEVRVYPAPTDADGDFDAQATGWKTPPPGLFGGDPGNVDSSALTGFDDAKAYIASNRDPQGFRLWTDVYRLGQVIVVAHVLGQNEADVTPVRQAIADAIRAELR